MEILKKTFLIGVDGGGTKTKLILTKECGEVISSTIGGPSNITRSINKAWESIKSGIEILLENSNIDIKNSDIKMGLGLAGAENEKVKQDFLKERNKYVPYINDIYLVSDAHAACLGIHKGKPGAIVIIGTGTQGYQVESDLSQTRIACWGSPVDDQGGGSWIGLEAIRHTFKCIDGRENHGIMSSIIFEQFENNLDEFVIWANKATTGEYASLTKSVIKAAKEKDQAAINILKRSAKEIELIINTLKSKQVSKDDYPLTLIGGMSSFIIPYLNKDIVSRISQNRTEHDICEGSVLVIKNNILK